MTSKQCTHIRRYLETDLFETADFIKPECADCHDRGGYDPICKDYITDKEIGDLLIKGFYGGDSK